MRQILFIYKIKIAYLNVTLAFTNTDITFQDISIGCAVESLPSVFDVPNFRAKKFL